MHQQSTQLRVVCLSVYIIMLVTMSKQLNQSSRNQWHHYFPPGLQLPLQPQSITALWPVPSYAAWWQRHMGVNKLPKAVTQHCLEQDLNPRPTNHKPKCLTRCTIVPPLPYSCVNVVHIQSVCEVAKFLIKSAAATSTQAATDGMLETCRVAEGGKMWRWFLDSGLRNLW